MFLQFFPESTVKLGWSYHRNITHTMIDGLTEHFLEYGRYIPRHSKAYIARGYTEITGLCLDMIKFVSELYCSWSPQISKSKIIYPIGKLLDILIMYLSTWREDAVLRTWQLSEKNPGSTFKLYCSSEEALRTLHSMRRSKSVTHSDHWAFKACYIYQSIIHKENFFLYLNHSHQGILYVDGWCASLVLLWKPCCNLSFSGFLPSTVPYWN